MENHLHLPEIEAFFAGNRAQVSLFLAVARLIDSIGAAKMEIKKTQISFRTTKKFAWVWLPLKGSRKRPPNSIVLTFGIGRKIVHKQIVEAVEPYPGRWTHHLVIQDESELNHEVEQWLAEAYAFSLQKGRSARS